MLMSPCFKSMPWGGTCLRELYGKPTPYDITGESWEFADHKNGCSSADGGPAGGMSASELIARFGRGITGSAPEADGSPLLFKLIDARDRLSVQVHPGDEYARRDGDNGKTEMWVVLDAAEGSGLYLGFKEPISRERFRELIERGGLESALNFIPVAKGDVFFIPSGMVHAIGEGLLIAEIQQSSDATYRVYDWGRMGFDGKPRPLHIEKALDVTDTALKGRRSEKRVRFEKGVTTEQYVSCRYFSAMKLSGDGVFQCDTAGESMQIIFVSDGEAVVASGSGSVTVARGRTALVPACAGLFSVSGRFTAYRFWVPAKQQL